MTEAREPADDLALPLALTQVAEVILDQDWDSETDEDRNIDFEPYERFLTPEEFARTFRLWTGNDEVDGGEFRIFGSTAGGDLFGFWLVRPGAPITEQPVIYLGSDGDPAVLTRDLGDLLWYFANGFLYEAAPNEALRVIAERHAPGRRRSSAEIEAAAEQEFPGFPDFIKAMCR